MTMADWVHVVVYGWFLVGFGAGVVLVLEFNRGACGVFEHPAMPLVAGCIFSITGIFPLYLILDIYWMKFFDKTEYNFLMDAVRRRFVWDDMDAFNRYGREKKARKRERRLY